MREILLAALMLSTGLVGCIGSDRSPGNDLSTTQAPNQTDENPWQAGLAPELETPDVALTANRSERRSDLAAPGEPRFASFDAAVEAFMQAYDIPAGAVAVLHDGELRYENGYGHLDADGTEDAGPRSLFRIASITKPMTAAVIRMMAEQDLLSLEDPVFCLPPDPEPGCLLEIEPHPNRPVVDDRLADIQVTHLLEHTSGWSTGGACNDALWSKGAIEAARDLGVQTPPPAWRLAQWVMGSELARDPGQGFAYCNMGYITLGLVAEAVTGATLGAIYDAYLFEPLEVAEDIQPGHTLPGDRDAREPLYACDHGETTSVFDPDAQVCWADGGFDLQGIMGAGGLVATASAVGAVLEVYEHDGEPRPEDGIWIESSSGSLPGTATKARTNIDPVHGEIQVVVLFNTRIGATPVPGLTGWHNVFNLAGNPPGQGEAQFLTCAQEYGLVRPGQCLAMNLMRAYVTAIDELPAG